MVSADPPWKNGWKIKKRKHAKKSSFLCLCYILRATRAGRCREWRYADHIFIQIYFRMHHFVVKFSENFFASGGKGALTPLTKILQTFLVSFRCRLAEETIAGKSLTGFKRKLDFHLRDVGHHYSESHRTYYLLTIRKGRELLAYIFPPLSLLIMHITHYFTLCWCSAFLRNYTRAHIIHEVLWYALLISTFCLHCFETVGCAAYDAGAWFAKYLMII